MLVECLKEVGTITLLVFWVELFLVWREESDNEEGAPCQLLAMQGHMEVWTSVQSSAMSHMASAQYFSSSDCPSYAPSWRAKCLRIA